MVQTVSRVMSDVKTPLQEQLAGTAGRPVALEAFRRARRTFLAGQRVDMGELARDLGINRATLYRWVGSRDQLLVEIVWSLADRTFDGLLDAAGVQPGRSRSASSANNAKLATNAPSVICPGSHRSSRIPSEA